MSGARLRRVALAGVLLAATFAAYAPALRAGYVWDDDDYVTENHLLWEEDGLRRIWFTADAPSQYFPLVYTTYRIEYALWGLDPTGYHVVNVLLHGLNALLFWRLLVLLGFPGGFLAAALFALHPVHVESVAWITERKNTLSLLFFLVSLIAWVRFTDEEPARRRLYLGSLAAFALSLFAKTTTTVLPAALVLSLWVRGRPVDRRRWLQIVPFVVLGLVMGMVTILWERVHQGTLGERFSIPWPEVWIVASRAVWFYLGKLAWPTDLAFSYEKFEVDASDPLQWGWLVAGALLVVALWLGRTRIGRAPIATVTYFVASLSPLLGFIALFTFQYTYVADHYQYIASLGPLALFAGLAAGRFAQLAPAGRHIALVAALVVLTVLGTLTFRQSRAYESRETLWRDTIAKNPSSWMAHHNLAEDLLRQGRLEEAVAAFEGALALRDDLEKTHRNLGVALWRQGRLPEAEAHMERAVRIAPEFYNGRATLAGFQLRTGRAKEARSHFEAMIRLGPGRPEGHEGLGRAHAALGERDAAERAFRAALHVDPQFGRAELGLADVLTTCPAGGARTREASRLVASVRERGGGRDPLFWASAARLQAARGDRAGAVAAAKRGLELARSMQRDGVAARLERELPVYEAGATWCPTGASR